MIMSALSSVLKTKFSLGRSKHGRVYRVSSARMQEFGLICCTKRQPPSLRVGFGGIFSSLNIDERVESLGRGVVALVVLQAIIPSFIVFFESLG
jgi:hypothetical protein